VDAQRSRSHVSVLVTRLPGSSALACSGVWITSFSPSILKNRVWLRPVLPGENEDDFEHLRRAVHADFSPSGAVEAFLVDRVVNALWRLRRVEKVETALLDWRVSALRIEQLRAEMRSYERSVLVRGFEMPLLGPQYETKITDKGARAAAERRLEDVCKERDRRVLAVGRVIDADLTGGEVLAN
jgi:hypothetical protein